MNDEQTRKNRQRKVQRLIEQQSRSVQNAISGTRKDKGLTQTEVAERMGWSTVVVGNIEQGRRDITLSEFIVLAQQMDFDPEVMFRRVLRW